MKVDIRKWVSKREKVNGNVGIVYDGWLYIFSGDGVLITVFAIPEKLPRKKVYLDNEYIRQPKKYIRYYDDLRRKNLKAAYRNDNSLIN